MEKSFHMNLNDFSFSSSSFFILSQLFCYGLMGY